MNRSQAITAMTITEERARPEPTAATRQPRKRTAAMRNPRTPKVTIVQHAQPGQNYGPGKEPQSAATPGTPSCRTSAKPNKNPRPANPAWAGDGPRFLHPPPPALPAEPRKENRQ